MWASTPTALLCCCACPSCPSPLEELEKLAQLRLNEADIRIVTQEVEGALFCLEIPEQLEKARGKTDYALTKALTPLEHLDAANNRASLGASPDATPNLQLLATAYPSQSKASWIARMYLNKPNELGPRIVKETNPVVHSAKD